MSCGQCDSKKKSMISLVIWKGLLFLYILTWHCCWPFNLDARYPKVFTSKPNFYFGYSVAFWNGPNGYKVLVGSPKAKSGTLVTGGLFQCDIENKLCEEVKVDKDLSDVPDSSKSNQWLGVSLDVSPMNESLVIVCAHRTKFDFSGFKDRMVGICYQIKDLKIVIPIRLTGNHNLFGISARYAKRSRILLIGMPGMFSFRGGYFLKMYEIETEILNQGQYSYAGYCVTILNNRSAIGIPRYNQYGGVWYQNKVISLQSKYAFGSYFGSALAAVDLDYNGKEDLIVGAPYYSEKFVEEGRVYIFFFSNNRLNDVANIILSVPSYRGQFGKTLATGDFNNDRYSDVIVAAPYENDGSGTIYIFSGHRFGLHKTFSQKIEGKNIQPNIQSFGISFSRTADVDSNDYEDIAVGAYMSDKVFVFFGRPIVQVKFSLKAEPNILSSCTDCWKDNKHITTLIQVEIILGKKYPMTFNIHLFMDTNRNEADKRTYLENGQKEFSDTVEIRNIFRKDFLVTIKNTVDILEPMNFTFTYYLKDDGYSSGCNSTCPIAKNGTYSTQVKFDVGCGSDEVCETYLKVFVKDKGSQLVLGRHQKFVLFARVENLGENAYGAKARIFYSKFLEFESVNQTSNSNVQCDQENEQELSCFLDHPLKEKSSVHFEVIFFIDSPAKEDSIKVIMNATTISKVPDNLINNTQILWVPIYLESKLEVTGFSQPENDVFRGSISKEMNMMHEYELRNNGPSDAFALEYFVLIPRTIFKNIELLKIQKIQIRKNDKVINNTCHLQSYKGTKDDFKVNIQNLRHNANVLNCTAFKCYNITCDLNQIQKNEQVIKIRIYFAVNIQVLKYFQGIIRSLDIVTASTLTQRPNYRVTTVHSDHAQAKTTIIINRLPAKLKWWVVICSIAVGLLILLIFSVLLWHCGYFKRARLNKKQIQEERAKEERSLLEHDAERKPSRKIYTREKVSESEELPEIE